MLKKMPLNAWWFRRLSIAAAYVLAAERLPNLLLAVVNSVGYLPYSDRPGPGTLGILSIPPIDSSNEPSFLASGLMTAAGGWLIAISPFGIYAAGGGGALWGFFLFPRLIPQMSRRFPTGARIALPILMLSGGAYVLIRPIKH